MGDWCTIESAPEVFSELIETIGCDNVEVEEVYDLSDEGFARINAPLGLVLLFRWRASEYAMDTRSVTEASSLPSLFFAKQVVTNACATQAMLSILLNSPAASLTDQLREFKEFTLCIDPQTRGESIGACDWIRTAHNSFSPPEPFIAEKTTVAKDDSDVFHFVSLLPFNDRVLELDGLKAGPIELGASGEEGWLSVARKEIARRIPGFNAGDLSFVVLALVPSQLKTAQAQLAALDAAAAAGAQGVALREQIAEAEAKRAARSRDNARRRHNYVPFMMRLLQIAAERGELKGMVEEAQTKASSRREARQKAKGGT